MFKIIGAVLFPKVCLNCKKFGRYLCSSCRDQLIYLEKPICFYCEKESVLGLTHEKCLHHYGVDRFISGFRYTVVLKKAIANIKYRLVSDAFEELFELIELKGLIKIFKEFEKPFYIQPVPLHSSRLKQRGFNQAELIAKWLVKNTDGLILNSLERVKATKAQANLGKKDRVSNTIGAFCLKKGIKLANLTVVVVDDVVTTGSTAAEATAVLKAAGASKAVVFSIAKD